MLYSVHMLDRSIGNTSFRNGIRAIQMESFENLYQRNIPKLTEMGIESGDRVKGYNCRNRGYQTFARVFYRIKHAPVIHLVIQHLTNKYSA